MEPTILGQVAAGDAAAVDACLKRFGGVVWSLARRFSPNEQDAEDAVQEIFLNLWRSAGRYDSEQGSEMTFVTTIARRRLIDRLRRRGRAPASDALEDASILPDDPAPDLAERADETALVVKAMEQLRPEQRDVLQRTLVSGQTQQEVADETGMPLGTVKSHARRGLHKVRQLLGLDPATGSVA